MQQRLVKYLTEDRIFGAQIVCSVYFFMSAVSAFRPRWVWYVLQASDFTRFFPSLRRNAFVLRRYRPLNNDDDNNSVSHNSFPGFSMSYI